LKNMIVHSIVSKKFLTICGIFLIILLPIGFYGRFLYRQLEKNSLNERQRELMAISTLKVSQIEKWRNDQIKDGEIIVNNPFFKDYLRQLFRNPADKKLLAKLTQYIQFQQDANKYKKTYVCDTAGNLLFVAAKDTTPPSTVLASLIKTSVAQKKVILSDLHRDKKDTAITMEIITPIIGTTGSREHVAAVAVFVINPYLFLFPHIQTWPVPSKTSETLLITRRGDSVMYLNELRHRKNTALNMTRSLNNKNLPATMALMGRTGIIEGMDYRNVPVFAMLAPIPKSGWYLIAKVDKSEFLKNQRAITLLTIFIIVIFIIMIGALLSSYWYSENKKIYRELFENEQKEKLATKNLLRSEARYHQLFDNINDAVFVFSITPNQTFSTFLNCNRFAEQHLEYTRIEMQKLTPLDIVAPEVKEDVKHMIPQFIADGQSLFETVHYTKTGKRIPVEINLHIFDVDGTLTALAIVRDSTKRKKIENELQKSEQRLKYHLEYSPLAVVEWNNNFIVTQWSKEAERIFGRKKEDVLGKRIDTLDLIYADDIPIVANTMNRLTSGNDNIVVSTNRNITLSGAIVECMWYNSVLLDENGQMESVMSLVQDITEREMEARNRALTAEIQSVLISSLSISETITQIISIIKQATKFDAVGIRMQNGEDFPYAAQDGFSQDFLLTENSLVARTVNGEICRDAHGNISLECTCGAVISGHIDPTNPLFTAAGSFWTNNSYPLLELTTDEDPRINPRNLCIHNGFGSVALIPIRENKKIIGLLHLNSSKPGIFTLPMINFYEHICEIIGITLLGKQAKNTLQISEQSYRNQFVNNSSVMLLIDPENGAIIDANTAAITFYGYTREQMLSMQISDINILPASVIRKAMATVQKEHGKKFYFQHRLADGSLRYVEASLSCIQFGGHVLLHSIIQDVTERHLVEVSLRNSNALLKESNAELDAFNYSVSHDLRGPLNIISMFSQLLGIDYAALLDEPGKKYIEHITNAIGRMTQIIDDLQRLTKISRTEIKPAEVNLSLIVRALFDEQLIVEDPGRKVTLVIADNIIVKADMGLMMIVMENLVRNALKFTSQQPHTRIEFSSQSNKEQIVCCMRDNGVGFNMDHAGKLFMPFKRLHTSEEFTGTGIGLAIIRRIIVRHGGKVWIEGEVGKGAAVYFELPNMLDMK